GLLRQPAFYSELVARHPRTSSVSRRCVRARARPVGRATLPGGPVAGITRAGRAAGGLPGARRRRAGSSTKKKDQPRRRPGLISFTPVVGDTGIEPVTSSVSRKRSPTELIARGGGGNRTRVQGFAGPCLSHSATPPEPGSSSWRGPWISILGGPPGPVVPPSGRRDSNPRPSPWQGDALPTALRPRVQRFRCGDERPLAQAPRGVQTTPLVPRGGP